MHNNIILSLFGTLWYLDYAFAGTIPTDQLFMLAVGNSVPFP